MEKLLLGEISASSGTNWFDVVSFIATVASLVLSIVAIWLSLVFFRMSNEASKATMEASKGISTSVTRLEDLFNRLYSDTFSMMRDTVSDMRKHMWPTEDSEEETAAAQQEQKAEEKIQELRKNVDEQMAKILAHQEVSQKNEAAVAEMRNLIDKAINRSRFVDQEAREETFRDHIRRALRLLRERQPNIRLGDLVQRMERRASASMIVNEVLEMQKEGLLTLSGDGTSPDDVITYRGIKKIDS